MSLFIFSAGFDVDNAILELEALGYTVTPPGEPSTDGSTDFSKDGNPIISVIG